MKKVLIVLALAIGLTGVYYQLAQASKTVTFVATINPGVLTTDIRDSSGESIADPRVNLGPVVSADNCQYAENALTGEFGAENARIYVDNPKATEGGWTLTIAPAQGSDAKWQGEAGSTLDFDDPGVDYLGCEDTDRDGAAGYLSINPRSAELTPDCINCSVDNLVLGPSENASFADAESLTLLRATSLSDSVGSWYLTGIDVKQTIPPSQQGDEYSLDLVLTATAS